MAGEKKQRNSALQNALKNRQQNHPNLDNKKAASVTPDQGKKPAAREKVPSGRLAVEVPEPVVERTRKLRVKLPHEKMKQILSHHYPSITADMELFIDGDNNLVVSWEE